MKRIIIVGAGASGLTLAIKLSDKNKVTLLEKNSDIGKKLLLTGSGRCNYYNEDMDKSHFYTDSNVSLDDFISENKKALDFYNDLGIIPSIKNGYYYPFSNTSTSVVNSIKRVLLQKNVNLITNYEVKKIENINDEFIVNDELKSDVLVLATGGLSYPKTGSTGDGYRFLKDFNLNIINTIPSLISLKSDCPFQKKWSGIRLNAKLSLYEEDTLSKEEKGEVLLTDYGISGICTFNISSIASRGLSKGKKEEVIINFVDFLNIESKADFITYLDNRDKEYDLNKVYELFDGFINYKLVNVLLGKYKDKKWSKLKREEKDIIASLFYELKLPILGTSGIEKAQVTSGGLDLNEVNLNTFEVKKVKNLYVIGELLDINGDCGGYNLTMCTLSAIKVGESIDKN